MDVEGIDVEISDLDKRTKIQPTKIKETAVLTMK